MLLLLLPTPIVLFSTEGKQRGSYAFRNLMVATGTTDTERPAMRSLTHK